MPVPPAVPPALAPIYAPPPDHGLELLFEDAALIVAVKPAGLLSVPGRGADLADCLSARVQQRFPDALVVHRLDLPTSGIVVFGRGADAQRELSRQFAARETEKRYVAIVAGRPADAAGTIELPLLADWPNRPRQKVDRDAGKPSVTHWRAIGAIGAGGLALPATRIELTPVTGRSHQLRVHLAAIGHAIVGDELYADAAIRAAAPRLLLHASALELAHPSTKFRLAFSSAPAF